jgi:pyruvate kinase
MRRLRRVKILATLGPASKDSATLGRLFEAGADVFRINMSHASHDAMRERIRMIRALSKHYGREIGILVDLQGPKLRVGEFQDGGVDLLPGQSFVLDDDKTPGDSSRVNLPHPEILRALAPGHSVLIDDGKVRLHITQASPKRAVAVVDVAGRISNRKGVSLPDTEIPVSAMTEKDRSDLDAALEEGVDWIAVSFVQRAGDLMMARQAFGDAIQLISRAEHIVRHHLISLAHQVENGMFPFRCSKAAIRRVNFAATGLGQWRKYRPPRVHRGAICLHWVCRRGGRTLKHFGELVGIHEGWEFR